MKKYTTEFKLEVVQSFMAAEGGAKGLDFGVRGHGDKDPLGEVLAIFASGVVGHSSGQRIGGRAGVADSGQEGVREGQGGDEGLDHVEGG